jgi:hypothetical protein
MSDVKLSALPTVTTITPGDKIPFTSAPGTTPVSKNITVDNLLGARGNLLTNSQWMAMSGSTLCEVTSGAAPVDDGANAALVNNLLSNGGFDSVTTGWTTTADSTIASVAGGKTGNCLEITRVGGSTQYFYAAVAVAVGKLYRLSFWVKSGTSGNEAFRAYYGSTDGLTSGTSSAAWVQYSIVFEATLANNTLYIHKDTATAGTMLFDSITLYEVTPGYVAADTLAPDTMSKTATLDVHRYWNAASANTYGYGTFLAKLTKGADTAEYLNFGTAINYRDCQGKVVTLGCYVYSVTATDNIKLSIHDGLTEVGLSSAHVGAGAITWVELTATLAAGATALTPRILCDGDTGDVAYISEPILLRGTSIGSGNYQPIPNEQILAAANIALTGYTATTSAVDAIINLEAASSGMIGKGAKAVLVKAYGKDSAVGDGVGFDVQSASTVEDGISIDTQVNNLRVQGQGWVKCDANGDIYFDHRGSGAAALTIDIKVIGVQT